MKKSPLWTIFNVFELSVDMRIGQDQALQLFDRCLLKLGNGDLPIAELPDSIHIQPENPYEIQDDSGIGIRESLRHFMDKILMQTSMLQSNSGFLDCRKGNANTKNSSVDQNNVTIWGSKFYPVLTAYVILEISSGIHELPHS